MKHVWKVVHIACIQHQSAVSSQIYYGMVSRFFFQRLVSIIFNFFLYRAELFSRDISVIPWSSTRPSGHQRSQ
ncbi:hypothetical protein JG688_00016877 [Phytophthora aleatoria]|uniref:Uncharacterized protein n=1 Tax=Phytophthora aleatoria TaxID=2496075 RepID=A0A8J5MCK4_9STRA|nr:hypothetical protein JG688_00016877 [Phytophthora aleatoria]